VRAKQVLAYPTSALKAYVERYNSSNSFAGWNIIAGSLDLPIVTDFGGDIHPPVNLALLRRGYPQSCRRSFATGRLKLRWAVLIVALLTRWGLAKTTSVTIPFGHVFYGNFSSTMRTTLLIVRGGCLVIPVDN